METYVKHNYWEGSTKIINIHTASKICQSGCNLSQWLYYNKGNNPQLYLLAIRVLSNLLIELNKYSSYSKNRYLFSKEILSRFTAHATRAIPLLQNCPLRCYFRAWAWSCLASSSARPWAADKLSHSCTKHSSQCSLFYLGLIKLLSFCWLCWAFSKLCEVPPREIVSWVSVLVATTLSQLILSAHLNWVSIIFLLHFLWQVKPNLIFLVF